MWTRILSRLEDQSLLVLGLVVVLVIYSCFRFLGDALKLLAKAYQDQEAAKTAAITSLAEEVRRGNEICHRHTGHMETIIRNQDVCRREMIVRSGGGA